jgi:2-C-methyl-D-erythritol 4-phosphate cytidylyltransferase
MSQARYWAVVPAAGVGRRMGSAIPKQYLQLNGRPVIEHTLETLLACPRIDGIYLSISPEDEWWGDVTLGGQQKIHLADGGAERCHSVHNALRLLQQTAASEDWVLVHDAARPCLRLEDLNHLIDSVMDHPVGGLLGVPVHDTMKRVEAGDSVSQTVSRDGLWHAQTPQMFRLGALCQALEQAIANGYTVTDDASAMELTGANPRMIEGHDDNIKITRPEDISLAAFYLEQQGRG